MGVVLGSIFMIVLGILGCAGTDQMLHQTTDRFGPWLISAPCLQPVTGIVMIIAEPVRELVNLSFWTKMVFVAVGTALSGVFLVTLPNYEHQGEMVVNRRSIKSLAILTFLVFLCIIVLGRLIAYDHIWGSWSPATSEY
jgi:hypothetical protein